jgi:hypothetical protein
VYNDERGAKECLLFAVLMPVGNEQTILFRREEKSFNKRYRIGVACSVEKHSTGINFMAGLVQYY